MLEVCAGYRTRLYPVGHISLRHPAGAVRELQRLAKEGVRAIFLGTFPVDGKSFGNPEFDPVWATAKSSTSPSACISWCIARTSAMSGTRIVILASCS